MVDGQFDPFENAGRHAWIRPLTPYPGWRFNIDWDNTQPGFPERRALWEMARDRGSFPQVEIPWHHGTRARIVLGNDVSQQVYIAGCLEPNEMAFLDRHLEPGMTMIDVGANEGLFALLAAGKVGATGTVWAFEPSPRERGVLEAALATQPHLRVRVFPVALGNRNGTALLKLAEPTHAGQNTLGAFGYPIGSSGDHPVSMRRLDDLVEENRLDRVDMIKVDVEGAESLVLEGAQKTLNRFRPQLLMEVLDKALRSLGSSTTRLLNQLGAQDYRILGFSTDSGLPKILAPGETVPDGQNIIGWPKEKPLPQS